MSEAKFTVDTHLFRELGQLLVGRDSTALVELVKNAYDADAKKVTVHGENLNDKNRGQITITDDGIGMTLEQFEKGFLRIASRLKEIGTRQSPKYHRRFTGAKGIGRLAAHKLSSLIKIYSTPENIEKYLTSENADNALLIESDTNNITVTEADTENNVSIEASIDWDIIESYSTLDELVNSNAISLESMPSSEGAKFGTIIKLQKLRRKWTESERTRFFTEIQTFSPPKALIDVPISVIDTKSLLFEKPIVRNSKATDPGFKIELSGDFEVGDDYWQNLASAAQWIIEIDASTNKQQITYKILPTKSGKKEFPEASEQIYKIEHPDPKRGPFFQARILIREGSSSVNRDISTWRGHASGVRVYMEGFRVLPYGELADDWLSIDATYTSRPKTLKFLSDMGIGESVDEQEGLLYLRKTSYFGGVFLTVSGSPTLQMLVNREGFIPEQGYENLVKIVRTGIDLSVRVRAAAKLNIREDRRETRISQVIANQQPQLENRQELRQAVELSVKKANDYAKEARQLAAIGDFTNAEKLITRAAEEFSLSAKVSERLMTEGTMLRVLASVGTQMTAFVHEINGILGSTIALESAITKIREDAEISISLRNKLARLQSAIGDLRRSVERQASYLTDIISPDARRRRSRQIFNERFDAAYRLVEPVAIRRGIKVINNIPPDLKSPPMFRAELTLVFSNLLTNAIKAAGVNGHIFATGNQDSEAIRIRIENTGERVNPSQGEKWFLPFQSTTTETDPILGQGMGMGLPITRNLLEEYGAMIKFVRSDTDYSTAIEISFPQ
jgi:signal transduction histidine kinase